MSVALGSGRGVFVAVNPRSGRTRHRPDPAPVLRERLPDAVVHVLAAGEDLGEVLRRRPGLDGDPVALGVSGGDGSVSAAAAVALEDGLPLLVLPGGTDNHFARLVGVDAIGTALDAAAAGSTRPVDLARVRGPDGPPLVALNTLNVGLYPGFVRLRERFEPKVGRHLAMLAAAALIALRSSPLEMTLNGRPERVWTLFVGVGGYAPPVGAPLQRTAAATGALDARMLRAGPVHRVAGVYALIRHGRRPASLGLRSRRLVARQAASFTVRGEHAPDVAHDGEAVAGTRRSYTGTVECVPNAIEVYAPAP